MEEDADLYGVDSGGSTHQDCIDVGRQGQGSRSHKARADSGKGPQVQTTSSAQVPSKGASESNHLVERGDGYGTRARQTGQGKSLSQLGLVDAEFADEWADSFPWDCRGADLDLEVEDTSPNEQVGSFAGEPPTSCVVKSYFGSSSSSSHKPSSGSQALLRGQAGSLNGTSSRHTYWEGGDAYTALYGAKVPAATETQHRSPGSAHVGEPSKICNDLEEGMKQQLQALDQQVKWYEREREQLKKLQAQAEQSERDVSREREKLWREVEAEKRALHAEFDSERAALRKERKRLGQGAERQRQLLSEDREMIEERRRLQDRSEQLEEELREKERRWQRTVDRLQRQISDLTRKNQELEEEVRRANQQAQQAQHGPTWQEPRRSASAASARGRRASVPAGTTPKTSARLQGTNSGAQEVVSTRFRQLSSAGITPSRASRTATKVQVVGSTDMLAGVRRVSSPALLASAEEPAVESNRRLKDLPAHSAFSRQGHYDDRARTAASMASDGTPPTEDIREVRKLDGRIERIFVDGRREVEFANGLRKVMWADGRTSVMFQNGDQKEIHPDGVIVYQYSATGAVQTTLPDGSELYHFTDGQFERHNPDGSKEIRFPNGTSKQIFVDGSEEVCFADGTVRRTPSAVKTASQ